MRAWGFSAMIASAALMTSGCGSKSSKLPDPVPVSGTVTLDGKPLANAVVYFRPEGDTKGNGATGTTDSNGKYELVTRIGDTTKTGAIPGNYRVWFSQMVGPDGKPVSVDSDTPPADLGAREALPPHLSDATQSQEKAQVGESGGSFDFKLSRKKKAFGAGGVMPR